MNKSLSVTTKENSVDRPQALLVLAEQIPEALRALPRWVNWRYENRAKRGGKASWTKVPRTRDDKPASTTNPSTWSTFEQADLGLILYDLDGIGLVLGDDVQGIDIDDCRDPNTGEISSLARRILERVRGYAEISPSGTGIKIFARTNLDKSRVDHEAGLELYVGRRYFAVTGHRIDGHHEIPDEIQDVSWLVREVFSDELRSAANSDAFENYKAPLEGWDIDRVESEVLVHLDPNIGYAEWLKIGQALHHQGQGAEDWLELWDSWSSASGKYVEGECADKWRSFATSSAKHPSITLASLLYETTSKRSRSSLEASHGGKPPLELLSVHDLLSLPPIEWTVKQLIPQTGLGVIFGPSGSGKTFVVLDIALAIARGLPWCQHKVRQSGVLYVAAEGAGGLKQRLEAYEKHHACQLEDQPFHVIRASVNLRDGDAARIVEACQQAEMIGSSVGLVVLDTLNQTMGAGDENSSADMTAYVRAASSIAELTGAFVLIVHHTGKDASRGARGHSSLRAAVDVELEMREDGDVRVLRVSKNRDGKDGTEFAFSLVTVDLGVDEDLEPVTSCVVVPASLDQAASRKPKPQGNWQQAICEQLEFLNRRATQGEIIDLVAKDPASEGKPRWKESCRTALRKLVERRVILQEGDVYSLA